MDLIKVNLNFFITELISDIRLAEFIHSCKFAVKSRIIASDEWFRIASKVIKIHTRKFI